MPSSTEDPEVVPVSEEPNHIEKWRNANVRVHTVNLPPNSKVAPHQHFENTLYICILPLEGVETHISSKSSPNETKVSELSIAAGELLWRDHRQDFLAHKFHTSSKTATFIVFMEIIKPFQRHMTTFNDSRLSRSVSSPDFNAYKLVLGPNESFQQDLASFCLVVVLQDTKVQVSSATRSDLDTIERDFFHAGDEIWLQPGLFSIQMKQLVPAKFILIEVL